MDKRITEPDHTLKAFSIIQNLSTEEKNLQNLHKAKSFWLWQPSNGFSYSLVITLIFPRTSDEGNTYLTCTQINSLTTETRLKSGMLSSFKTVWR